MLKVGLYGINGHQIHHDLIDCPLAKLVATAAFPREQLPDALNENLSIRHYATLDELLADNSIDVISLCSPRRVDQAQDAIKALAAGKHVLAEKPCALNEDEMDDIMATAARHGKIFHEMAGTAFGQPYYAMRELVRSGTLGEIVQVIAEKSYPYYNDRAQDEDLDGGIICQNGVHALRLIEHAAGTPIRSISAIETGFGNPVSEGHLQMAASIIAELENGGVATVSCNYLNQKGSAVWGEDSLKILGTKGYVKSRSGGQFTRVVVGEEDLGSLDLSQTPENWLTMVFNDFLGRKDMPLTLKDELSPTRWAIRAKLSTLKVTPSY